MEKRSITKAPLNKFGHEMIVKKVYRCDTFLGDPASPKSRNLRFLSVLFIE